MKSIKAIVQRQVLSNVVRSLEEMPGFPGLTISEALGQGRQHDFDESSELTSDNMVLHHKKMLEVVAEDALVSEIVERIRKSAHTGRHGDGLITVSPLENVVRIRSGELHDAAH